MLQFFRSKASSWVMKIILGLILLSFGLWGISGIFAGRGNQQIVAEVGGIKIGKDYFLHLLQQRVRDANKALKGTASFTIEQAIQLGVHRALLNELINKTLLDLESKRIKLTTDLESLKALIKSDPIFADKDGKFDRNKYEDILKRSAISEEQLVLDKQKSLINMQLLSSVTALSNIPSTLSIELFKILSERRYFKIYEINPKQLAEKKSFKTMSISPAEIEKFYEENKELYRVPEKRRATILIINTNKISQNYAFKEDEIKQAYEEKIGDYVIPEKRDIVIWTTSDETEAKAMHADLKNEKYKKYKDYEVAMNNITQEDLQNAVADVVFDATEASLLPPVETEDGFQIVKIKKIKPSKTQTLREVRTQVIDDLKQQKISEDIANLTQEIEDAVSGGSTLEEIARTHKLAIVNSGFFERLDSTQNTQVSKEMIKAAFDQEIGEDGPVIENGPAVEGTPNTLFLLRVDEVKESHIPEMGAVTHSIKEKIILEKALQEAKGMAEEFVKLHGNAADTYVKKNASIRSKSYSWITMQAATDKKLDPAIIEKAFAQPKGGKDIISINDHIYIVENLDIRPVEVESNLGEYKEMKNTLMEVLNQDIFAQYMKALKEKHGVEVYDEEINTLLN